jgi:hypothetical protein
MNLEANLEALCAHAKTLAWTVSKPKRKTTKFEREGCEPVFFEAARSREMNVMRLSSARRSIDAQTESLIRQSPSKR